MAIPKVFIKEGVQATQAAKEAVAKRMQQIRAQYQQRQEAK